MSTADIEKTIGDYIIADSLQGNGDGFNYDVDLLAVAVIDSVSLVQLVVFLETTFQIEIDPGDLNPSNLRTVNAISDMVRRLLSKEMTT